MQVQATNEGYVPLTLDTQYGVDVDFTTVELTLSIDDFGKRILAPAMSKISSGMDQDGLLQAKKVYNQVGTAGTTPGTSGTGSSLTLTTSPQVYLNAGALMDLYATPRDRLRRICVGPIAQALSVASLSGLFESRELIAEQYREGVMGRALGFEFAMDQNTPTLTNGTHASTCLISGASQTGASITLTTGLVSDTLFKEGEIVTLPGCFGVNPENQTTTGLLQQFVVTADCTTSATGAATLAISPSIVVAGTSVANGTVTASPTNGGAVIPYSGSAAATNAINLAYHRDAFCMGSADLMMPEGLDWARRESFDGISMRILRQYVINSDQMPCRIDVLAGFKTLRPELACRIAG